MLNPPHKIQIGLSRRIRKTHQLSEAAKPPLSKVQVCKALTKEPVPATAPESTPKTRLVTRGGKTYEMRIDRIGRTPKPKKPKHQITVLMVSPGRGCGNCKVASWRSHA